METVKTETSLYKEIIKKSYHYEQPPENAYINTVWQKVPGRNGLKINIDESYKQMKKDKVFNQDLLVYEQVNPEINIKDLQAAPIYRGHHEKEMVALLFYVVAGSEYLPSILNILKEEYVQATFFIEGKWASENKRFVQMIDEQGHAIGNHGYNYSNMGRLSKIDIREQMEQSNRILKAITGKTPNWFAPPSGSFTEEVIEVANNLDMETVLWSVDVKSWENPSVKVMMDRIETNIHPGATVFLHLNHSIVQGLPQMIHFLKNKGYSLDTIDELLSEER